MWYNTRVNHIKSSQVLITLGYPLSTCDRGARTMSHSKRGSYFSKNLDGYAPWVATYGLVAPYGKCQCGCGLDAPVAARTQADRGNRQGHPVRFFADHSRIHRHAIPVQLPIEPGTALIPLTRGAVAIVDVSDYEWLMQWKWRAIQGNSTMYAVRRSKGRLIFMHREIMGVTDPETLIDHADRDGLNNRRCNIRVATRAENMRNRIMCCNNKSGYKGVNWSKAHKKWIARIGVDNKRRFLGHFESAESAAHAYDRAARELHGKFARLNFPDEGSTG